ncbi:MAG: hypothetical protein MJ237_05210 [bacterium]|nr:hypothetical protein [bacterium]
MKITPITNYNCSSEQRKNNNSANINFGNSVFLEVAKTESLKNAFQITHWKHMADITATLGSNSKKYSDKIFRLLHKKDENGDTFFKKIWIKNRKYGSLTSLFKYKNNFGEIEDLLKEPYGHENTVIHICLNAGSGTSVDKYTQVLDENQLDRIFKTRDDNKNTPLMSASCVPKETFAKLSYSTLKDLTQGYQNNYGETLFYRDFKELTQLLIDRLNSDDIYIGLKVKDNHDETALFKVSAETVEILISKLSPEQIGNLVLEKNDIGNTLFHVYEPNFGWNNCHDRNVERLKTLATKLTPEYKKRILTTKNNAGNTPIHSNPDFYQEILPYFDMKNEDLVGVLYQKDNNGNNFFHKYPYSKIQQWIKLAPEDFGKLLCEKNNKGIAPVHILNEFDFIDILGQLKNYPDIRYQLATVQDNNGDTIFHREPNFTFSELLSDIPSDKIMKLILTKNNNCETVMDVLSSQNIELFFNKLTIEDAKKFLSLKDIHQRTILHTKNDINMTINMLYRIAKDDFNKELYDLPSVKVILNQEDIFGMKAFSNKEIQTILYTLCDKLKK